MKPNKQFWIDLIKGFLIAIGFNIFFLLNILIANHYGALK